MNKKGLTTRTQLTIATSHEDGLERDRLHLKGEETNMELVHKALSMGGKCMLNNSGQSQYAQIRRCKAMK